MSSQISINKKKMLWALFNFSRLTDFGVIRNKNENSGLTIQKNCYEFKYIEKNTCVMIIRNNIQLAQPASLRE